jgi:LytS/YehU family sensor histidine kinase
MTIKQIVAVIGGLVIGAVVSLVILLLAGISLESFGAANMALTTILFGLVGMIGLDSLLKAGILTQ